MQNNVIKIVNETLNQTLYDYHHFYDMKKKILCRTFKDLLGRNYEYQATGTYGVFKHKGNCHIVINLTATQGCREIAIFNLPKDYEFLLEFELDNLSGNEIRQKVEYLVNGAVSAMWLDINEMHNKHYIEKFEGDVTAYTRYCRSNMPDKHMSTFYFEKNFGIYLH